MRQAFENLINIAKARPQVWLDSATLSFCASALALEAGGVIFGPIESPAPVALLSLAGLFLLLSIYEKSPREWSGLVHCVKHWHRRNICKERRREREREARMRREKLDEEREQARRVRLANLTRLHRFDDEDGGQ